MKLAGGLQIAGGEHIKSCDEGARDWFTAAELADLALPGLPADKRSLNRRAREENWLIRCDADGEPLARPRSGRGGGTEFHVSLLPGAARLELAKRGLTNDRPAPTLAVSASAEAWRWYDAQTTKTKDEARARLPVVEEITLLQDAGLSRSAALAEASRRHSVCTGTIRNWLKSIDGVPRTDWLPALAPRRIGGGREAEIHEYLWNTFLGDYLRPSAPTLAACYDRTVDIATERGLSIPSQAAFRRRIAREFPKAVITLRRQGPEALRRSVPAQRRTVDHLHALELVNIDGHEFDVRVIPPGGGDPVRPMMVAIQDVMSSKVLAFNFDLSENSILTQIVFRDLFRDYGLPKACLLDNGRAFASKRITGGSKTRFRFKIKDDEPTGVLTALDINPKWALPYRGQSKPIERAFKEMCEQISKHPATEGAYVGNSPANKPHNYASRAMEWDDFVAHVSKGIARHNAKTKRTGRHYAGRSFDEVFNESYAVAPINKATPEQLRLALLTATHKRIDARTSEIQLFGNRYWEPGLAQFSGERVMVRFDPENLHSEVYVYSLDGRFLMAAPVIEDSGFDSQAGAIATQKRVAEYRKQVRRLEEMQMLPAADEVARRQAETQSVTLPEPAVLRPVRHRGQTAAALKAAPIGQHIREVKQEAEDRMFAALSLVPRND